jgi:hypothetical protein
MNKDPGFSPLKKRGPKGRAGQSHSPSTLLDELVVKDRGSALPYIIITGVIDKKF